MKKGYYIFVLIICCFSCNKEIPTQFSETALNDTFITLQGNSITFKDVLERHKGETLVIDIWASWCSDCIKNMPKVKALQNQYKDATFLFLSLDRNQNVWKRGISKYQIKGEHYFMPSGWDGPFAEFADLDWIPRYMIVGPEGEIKLFEAVKADDKRIKELL